MPFPIRVSDVMSRPVRTATPETTAAAAAARCHEESVGSLVVVEDGDPVGIVTSSDLLEHLGTATDPGGTPLREFMSSPVVTTDAGAPVGDAVATMFEHGIARLAVLEAGDLVGVVSTDDVLHCVPQVLQRRELADAPPEAHRYRVYQDTAYEESDWEFECMCASDAEVSVGDRVTFAKTIREQDVRAFAAASGDTNRLHLDDEYAEGTRFGRRIAHGTLVGGLISAALARLPGVTIYLSQDLSFLSAVGVGDRVTATCEIVESLDGDKYELTTDVLDADDERVIEGQAVVLVDPAPETAHVEVEPLA